MTPTLKNNFKPFGFVILSSLLILFLGVSLSFAATAADLRLSILPDKKEYQSQEPVSVSFQLENRGKSAICVNKRFYLGAEEMPQDNRELYLIITSPSGKKMDSKFRYETGLPKTEYFVILEPGKSVASEWKRDLRGYFEFNESGSYKAVAIYQNFYGGELGLDTFKDKVVSELVTFKVIKADAKK